MRPHQNAPREWVRARAIAIGDGEPSRQQERRTDRAPAGTTRTPKSRLMGTRSSCARSNHIGVMRVPTCVMLTSSDSQFMPIHGQGERTAMTDASRSCRRIYARRRRQRGRPSPNNRRSSRLLFMARSAAGGHQVHGLVLPGLRSTATGRVCRVSVSSRTTARCRAVADVECARERDGDAGGARSRPRARRAVKLVDPTRCRRRRPVLKLRRSSPPMSNSLAGCLADAPRRD